MKESKIRSAVRLHLAEGVGAVIYRRLVDAFGDADAVVAAPQSQWRKVQGVGEKLTRAIAAVTDQQVSEEFAEAERHGVEILCLEDDSYPTALKAIYNPPPMLYVRGRLEGADAVAMAIVGARRCTHYGLEQAERFGQLLGRAGFTIVSGGARGIDTAAHRGAIDAGGRTVVVMGCGLSQVYPAENEKLFEQIVADGRGAMVSELPMRTAVLGGNFPTRNRIISGLSLGVLIIEAARRSGSLITAREADEQGRVVFAVPGRVDSPTSQGVNRLIRDGAILVQDLDDVLEHLGEVGERLGVVEPQDAAAVPVGLNETEMALFDALADGQLGLDELVRRSGLQSGQVASAMTMLVLKGAVEQRPGNVFSRKAPKAGAG